MELFINCLEYAIKKDNELPMILNKVMDEINNQLGGKTNSNFNDIKGTNRSAKDILKDYGLEHMNLGSDKK